MVSVLNLCMDGLTYVQIPAKLDFFIACSCKYVTLLLHSLLESADYLSTGSDNKYVKHNLNDSK
jgi:hypothetical protein